MQTKNNSGIHLRTTASGVNIIAEIETDTAITNTAMLYSIRNDCKMQNVSHNAKNLCKRKFTDS